MKNKENTNSQIDQFFRESLRDHTIDPSPKARESFLNEAGKVSGGRAFAWRWLIILSTAIILLITGIWFITRVPGGKSNAGASQSATKDSIHKADSGDKGSGSLHVSSTPVPVSKPTFKRNPVPKIKSIPSASKLSEEKQITILSSVTSKVVSSSTTSVSTTIVEPPVKQQDIPQLSNRTTEESKDKPLILTSEPVKQPEPAPVLSVNTATLAKPVAVPEKRDTLQTTQTNNTSHSSKESYKPEANLRIDAGLYFSPEWMFNTLQGEKFVNNFGLEGTFRFGKYSIRTGIGASITKGTNEVVVAYNDYLGSYKKLDSISFKWDQQQQAILPTYYLTSQNVWDSLMKLDNHKIEKRYTYLQIPLILGYDIWTTEHFTLGLRAGPILSLLIYSKQLAGDYDPGLNRIISINQISPERIATNWQIMGGMNFCYYPSRRFGIEVEPNIRYYFNSVYEKMDDNKRPWSIGFRIALLLRTYEK